MEIEVEADKVLKKEKSIAKLFSPKKTVLKKVEQKKPEKTELKSAAEPAKKIKTVSKNISKVAIGGKRGSRAVLFVIPLLASLSLVLGASTFYYHSQYVRLVKTPILLEKSDRQLVLDNINSLAELPGEENPIVATVGDVKKLIGEAFSLDVADDDRVVIYTDAKKAIIYRPSSGKIVEAAPFLGREEKKLADVPEEVETDLPDERIALAETSADTPVEAGTEKVLAETSEQLQAPKEEKKARVAIYNGTKTKGLSAKLADQISVSNASVDIVSKTSAKGDYAKTIVIDLTGKNTDLIANIASLIGGDIYTSFPQDELMPEADILVIGGAE